MIDLHVHSEYSSDSKLKIKDLLNKANNINLKVLSITDHDTLKAYDNLESYKDIFKGKIITGIELNTIYNGVKIELLGYGFDVDKLKKFVYENYEYKKLDLNKEFEIMIDKCNKNNIKIDNLYYDEHMGYPIDIIYPSIKKHKENKKHFKDEEWNNIDIFFNSCTSDINFPLYFDFSIHYPKADIVSDAIKKAGGKVFVAHVFRYKIDNHLKFIQNMLKDKIIDGIEVYHSSFSKEQIDILKKYSIENNILISGGSDYHGGIKKGRELGRGYGNLNISIDILKNWNLNID